MSQNIDYLQIQLASPKEIERWSRRVLPNNQVVGEITKADTINYRTFVNVFSVPLLITHVPVEKRVDVNLYRRLRPSR
jgi:hypothetical protein